MELENKLNKLARLDPFCEITPSDNDFFLDVTKSSFIHHMKNCAEFNRWCNYFNLNTRNIEDVKRIEDFPYIPSSSFKKINLISGENLKGKSILSSGTSSTMKSRIFIDAKTAKIQKEVLVNILSNIIGSKRMHCYIFDSNPKITKNNNELSGRQAGMTGYLLAAKSRNYFLDSDLISDISINSIRKLNSSVKEGKPIYLIGYTFMIFQIIKIMQKNNLTFKLPKNSKFIHFGGWKNMEHSKISKKTFNDLIIKTFSVDLGSIYDIYGFTEQLGTIYPSVGNNPTHIPKQSRVIVRDPNTLLPTKNTIGFLQFINPFPLSYPGISILQDDFGMHYKNKPNLINVYGRLKGFEQRGCGDTIDYETRI